MRPTTLPCRYRVRSRSTRTPCEEVQDHTSYNACMPKDSAIAHQIQQAFQKDGVSAVQSIIDATIHVKYVWSRLKFPTLKAATEVCGLEKNTQV